MPERTVPGTDIGYHLLLFDEDGHERRDENGALYSDSVLALVARGVTDVFVVSHGWMGDIPAAIRQYDRWVGVMARQERDLQRMRSLVPEFEPLVAAVHWPSRPWGVEEARAALLGDVDDTDEFATENDLEPAELVELYAPRIGDTPETRAALTTIVDSAQDAAVAEAAHGGELSPELEAAYRTLFAQAGLGSEGALGAPGADQPGFDPKRMIGQWEQRGDETAGQGAMLGLGDDLVVRLKKGKDTMLGPVRQLSFWSMKKRARVVGETGVHGLVAALQAAAPGARIHLMGHSFGCIVVSAAIAGARRDGAFGSALPRPVDAVFLVQGAMSLWSYAEQVSFAGNQPGYFRDLLSTGDIRGPLVTTQSTFDTAVGKYYPIGAKVGHQVLLGDDEWPEYGGLGAFGIQGADAMAVEILAAPAEYGLKPADVVNVDSSRVICQGSGASGAHSDICHDDVAHLMWQAVTSARTG